MTLKRIGAIVLGAACCLPALADTSFRVRRMNRNDVPVGRGQCDIRLQVDNEVEVAVRGDGVFIRTVAGRDAHDDGNSECNMPLPDRPIADFNFEVKDSRGEIRLLAEPSRRNNWAVVVAIRDSSGGQGRYHFRLTWDMRDPGPTGGGFGRPDFGRPGFGDDRPGRGGPGFVWNNVINFRGNGRGNASLSNGFDQRLGDVNVDIDRGGRVLVVFRAEKGRELSFTGQLVSRDGGRLRADVMSQDRRMRGPMFISVGDRDNVNAISFEGGDGRDRMRITWDRR
jgi:hypothetical protein